MDKSTSTIKQSLKKIEEITPKYAEQCEELRKKMRELVAKYISKDTKSS